VFLVTYECRFIPLSVGLDTVSGGRTVGLRPLACWDCGFEFHRGNGCPSNSIYTIRPTNSFTWNVFISCYSLPTCFDLCRGHHQRNLQEYKESKQAVKIRKCNNVSCECRVLSGRGLCDRLILRPGSPTECVCVCVFVCVSFIMARYNDSPEHLQRVGRKGENKK